MIGAIVGDIAGSRFEWNNHKSKDFELLAENCSPTDDSIMTLAVAAALLDCGETKDRLSECAVQEMQRLGRLYPRAGYGGRFVRWIASSSPHPYNSYGNGAAMRVSPCGFAAKSESDALFLADAVTCVTHNHPEGMKAAEATSLAIFLARSGKPLQEIRKTIKEKYYSLDFTLDSIRENYRFDVSCQGSVPQALEAFFESNGFEDAIRNAISIGGDSDTIAAITGGIAEAYYGVPEHIRIRAERFLDRLQLDILHRFEETYGVT
jgi:ADP-ribosylglycohydrolase